MRQDYRINRNHPLARGLVGFWPFGLGPLGLGSVPDVTGICTEFVLNASSRYVVTPYGPPGVGRGTTAQAATLASSTTWQPTGGATIWWCGAITNNGPYLFGNEGGSSGVGFYNISSTPRGFMYINAFREANVPTTSVLNQPTTLAVQHDQSAAELTSWMNGVSGSSAATGGVSITWGSNGLGLCSITAANNTSGCGADTVAFAIWSRPLLAAEHQWLFNDPFDLLIPAG